ncbi:MAG: efflux RND transporter periplasmic adaptor subunit [Nitrospirae bacterium]|nr:efflux RND transporter periplasmic adaptor subunit [Nitrospirota bacterium]
MKKMGIAILMITALGIVAFFALRNEENALKFRTEKVIRGDIQAAVTATGTLNAVTTVLVGTQVSGTIKNIHADFNSPVKKGELIAEIDPATFEAQAEQARANLLTARANLEKSVVALIDTERTMNRSKELFSKDFVARSELDTAETNYSTAKAQVSAAKAQVAQAEAALKAAETNLRYTKILSPVDGVVVSRNVDVGQTVAASFQTPTLFTIAQDLTKMQINTNVDEADIGRIQISQDVEFTVDAYPDTLFKGGVSQIRIAPIIVQNVVTYDVVIRVDNPEQKLKPGMTANVSILVAGKRDILKVPNMALRFRPPETGKPAVYKNAGVWILANQSPKRITVTTGIGDDKYTEILSGEIREGQEVIVEAIGAAKSKQEKASSPPRFFF